MYGTMSSPASGGGVGFAVGWPTANSGTCAVLGGAGSSRLVATMITATTIEHTAVTPINTAAQPRTRLLVRAASPGGPPGSPSGPAEPAKTLRSTGIGRPAAPGAGADGSVDCGVVVPLVSPADVVDSPASSAGAFWRANKLAAHSVPESGSIRAVVASLNGESKVRAHHCRGAARHDQARRHTPPTAAAASPLRGPPTPR